MSYEIEEVRDFVDGAKSLKVSARQNPLVVYGGTWKLFLDKGMEQVTRMLLQSELSGKEMGFFLYLVQEMGPGNAVTVSQKALAQAFGCSAAYVSKVLGQLKAVDLLREGMLSPLVVTKGRTEDYEATLRRWHATEVGATPRVFGNQ